MIKYIILSTLAVLAAVIYLVGDPMQKETTTETYSGNLTVECSTLLCGNPATLEDLQKAETVNVVQPAQKND